MLKLILSLVFGVENKTYSPSDGSGASNTSWHLDPTDAVNIKNAWIINIGVDFEIVTIRGFNKREVLLKCVNVVRDFFEIDNWQINQPVSISDLIYEIGLVEGVQTVIDVSIRNLWDENLGYSGNVYDIDEAVRNKVLYPSMDPSIFEVKFPNQDIRGKVQEG